MINYNVANDLKTLRIVSGLSQEDFAKRVGLSFSTINRIENKQLQPTFDSMNKIYNFAYQYRNGMARVNEIGSAIAKDELGNILFHAAKEEIIGELDLEHSRFALDFGKGVYFTEFYDSAKQFIRFDDRNSSIYMFSYDLKNLNFINFSVCIEWALAIAFYRGMLNKYNDSTKIKEIVKKVESADIIIAPIADNTMFDIIGTFVEGLITDQQLIYSLATSNLGNQYVFRTNKALKRLRGQIRFFICEKEREAAKSLKVEQTKVSLAKSKVATETHRREGLYIEELLK